MVDEVWPIMGGQCHDIPRYASETPHWMTMYKQAIAVGRVELYSRVHSGKGRHLWPQLSRLGIPYTHAWGGGGMPHNTNSQF